MAINSLLLCGLLAILFLVGLFVAKTQLMVTTLECRDVRPADKQPTAFLLFCALLLIVQLNSPEGAFWEQGIMILLYGVCAYASNYFVPNPLMNILGYRFYEVEIKNTVPLILVSKKIISGDSIKVRASQIDDFVYLDLDRD